jgi:hypothetical protein
MRLPAAMTYRQTPLSWTETRLMVSPQLTLSRETTS